MAKKKNLKKMNRQNAKKEKGSSGLYFVIGAAALVATIVGVMAYYY